MRANVTLNLSGTSNAQILIDAAHYTSNMTGNNLFAATDIVAQITATTTAAANLRTAMIAPLSDFKVDNIKVAREVLDRNLTILASKVETVANNPNLPDDQRISVIHSAGMDVRGSGKGRKRVFSVDYGDVDGSVYLTAPSGAKAHEWQYTADVTNFTGRIAASSTTNSTTEITGLLSGVRYAFFHKAIITGQATDWEGPLFLRVE